MNYNSEEIEEIVTDITLFINKQYSGIGVKNSLWEYADIDDDGESGYGNVYPTNLCEKISDYIKKELEKWLLGYQNLMEN